MAAAKNRTRFYNVLPHGRETREWIVEKGAHRALHDQDGNPHNNTSTPRSLTDPSIDQAVKNHWGPETVVEEVVAPQAGASYPRIFRPGSPALVSRHRALRDTSVHAARVLFRRLRDLFQVIEPKGRNLNAYGHATRDLLVLACTEVESGWKAVLRENGYRRADPRSSGFVTPRFWNVERDYLAVSAPMHLAEWEVELIGHAHVKAIRPFANWAKSAPPAWYRAYNDVKHDRESNFSRATLRHCIDALAAVFVMVSAQFGTWTGTGAFLSPMQTQMYSPAERDVIDTFRLAAEPAWPLSEYYAPPALVGRAIDDWRIAHFWR